MFRLFPKELTGKSPVVGGWQKQKNKKGKNKMTVKYITVKGQGNLSRDPFYIGVVQHERTMSRREVYEYCAERSGLGEEFGVRVALRKVMVG